MLFKSRQTNILINLTLVLLIIFIISKISYILKPFTVIMDILLLPMIISMFFYYALRSIVWYFEAFKLNKSLVIIMVLAFFTLLISILTIYGGSIVTRQFQSSFAFNLNTITNINTPFGRISDILSNLEVPQESINSLNDILRTFIGNIGGLFSQIGNIGTQAILVPFILFYFLKDGGSFVNSFTDVIPSKYRGLVKDALARIDEVLSTYISGQLLVALVIGILMFFGYLIIGMPNALLMAFFSMVTSIIPFLGPFLGIIPALLISLTINLSMVIKVIIAALIVQQIEGNLITPNIIGNKLRVHPLSIILIIIISVSLFGFLGAFVGIPVYIALKILFKTLYKIYKLERANMNDSK